MSYADEQNAAKSQVVRDETRRPMVTRATEAAKPRNATLLEEMSQRINDVRQRVLDCASRTRMHADCILGTRPETADDRNMRSIPHHDGALGVAFSELMSLEQAVTMLEDESMRLNGVA